MKWTQCFAWSLTAFLAAWILVYDANMIVVSERRSLEAIMMPAVSLGEVCVWKLVAYAPSEWEREWVTNVREYQDEVCEYSNRNVTLIEEWVQGALNAQKDFSLDLPKTVFSSFTFQNNCTLHQVTDYIEPLAGLTRHPYMCLKGRSYVGNKDYLIVSSNVMSKLKALPGGYVPKAYYFDLGASLFDSGAGGASQKWIVEKYQKRGVQWSGLYCWEAQHKDPRQVWAKVPSHLKPVYHWYNVPTNPAVGHADNGLEYIRKVARVEDFVVLKIDIDNTPVEEAFLSQLLSSPDLLALVDDLYFEHHVNVRPMHPHWKTQAAKERLEDTYRIFSQLRQHGVLAHSWV